MMAFFEKKVLSNNLCIIQLLELMKIYILWVDIGFLCIYVL